MTARDAMGLQGELHHDEPMWRHTSWRVGGPAQRYYRPADLADLGRFLASLPDDEPIHWLGLGSNVLIRDGGLRGTVVATHPALRFLERIDETGIRAGAGVACAKIARRAGRWGLAGGDFFAGIPGTLGGALTMNAGAFGGETWERVERVEVMDRKGNVHERTPADYRIGYRSVDPVREGDGESWFVAASLRFEVDPGGESAQRIRALLAERGDKQPLGVPSCGSVFRNPPGDHAARLIEAAGLKGRRLGGARVSEKHANFILNTDGATAADVEALIELVQEEVERCHGIRLEREVRIMGEPT